MRLFGRNAAADLEGRNLRLLFNHATAAITRMRVHPIGAGLLIDATPGQS